MCLKQNLQFLLVIFTPTRELRSQQTIFLISRLWLTSNSTVTLEKDTFGVPSINCIVGTERNEFQIIYAVIYTI